MRRPSALYLSMDLAVLCLALAVLVLAGPIEAAALGLPGEAQQAHSGLVTTMHGRVMARPAAQGGATRIISRTQVGSIHYGRGVVADSDLMAYGIDNLFYSMNKAGTTGFVYSDGPGYRETAHFAGVISPTTCLPVGPSTLTGTPGYHGPRSICDVKQAAAFTYSDLGALSRRRNALAVGDRASPCYEGLIVYRQGGIYGAIDPVDMLSDGAMLYDWWYNESGGDDFTAVCESASTVPAPTAPPSPLVCPGIQRRVPPAAIADALANPHRIQDWNCLCYPNRPEGPFNGRRRSLSTRSAVPFHPLYNSLVFTCGCP